MEPYLKGKACDACGERGDTSEFVSCEKLLVNNPSEDTSYIKRMRTNCHYSWKELPIYLTKRKTK